ncbi:putative transferase CAF17, mitochondrial [Discoglossus pictus]
MLLRRPLSLLLRPWVRRLSGLCCPLAENRGLLRFRGPDTNVFLQGLMTNDIEQLREGALYSHLLNVQGRTLYDVILYRLSKEQNDQADILLECDMSALEPIQKHLKVYNFRRKVDVTLCPELSVWAVIPALKPQNPPDNPLPAPVVLCNPDPRVAMMGWRLVAETGGNPVDLLPESSMGNFKDYSKLRYEQGVPEGVNDLPPGVALPLESNLAYMNGISFSKGCYIGQELTARTHHTGVIRKRLVPVQLSLPLPDDAKEVEILTKSGKSAGKYRSGGGNIGLALLRLAHINEELHIKISDKETISVKASQPEWWPKASDT